MSPERIKLQKDQQRAWLQQQMREREQSENDKMQADRISQQALEARDRRALELDESERQTRRQIMLATTKFNLNLVSIKYLFIFVF